MIQSIDIKEGVKLEDYESYASLFMAVRELYREAHQLVPQLQGRKVWMINSTELGGGVAEMMPRLVSLLRQLGVEIDWLVMSTREKRFFRLTKKLHNLIHGEGEPKLSNAERELYEIISKRNAEELITLLKPGDIVVIHDPQPMGMAKFIEEKIDVITIWRCHIGLDEQLPQTKAAWAFLKPYAEAFDHAVFSAIEYIPDYLAGKSTIIFPTIDPLDHKNRDLPMHKLVGILCNSNLSPEYQPVLTPPFSDQARRLQTDKTFASPLLPQEIGLLFRPVISQISRWDKLKGFMPLMKAFTHLKKNIDQFGASSPRHHRRLELLRLVLAGPDPDFVHDDPEGRTVLHDLCEYFFTLPPEVQADIAILKLPMTSRKENALMVNALQRISTIVTQNSKREGFGLTVTEAMWKITAVLGSNAVGIRQQIREGMDGRIVDEPENPEAIAKILNGMLDDDKCREVWGYSSQKRVLQNYLIFSQVRKWLNVFVTVTSSVEAQMEGTRK